MATITVSLPSDGDTIDVADYNTPINTIVNEINGGIDSDNLENGAVTTAKIVDGAVTTAKLTYPIIYGGGTLTAGTVTKTFTPAHNGLLWVTAQARRNSGTAGDLVITISATGVSNAVTQSGVGNGTVDGHASTTYLATVTSGTSVTISIAASGGSVANSGYQFTVMPGTPSLV